MESKQDIEIGHEEIHSSSYFLIAHTFGNGDDSSNKVFGA